ncbi:16303_t:CDS:1, partial [Cetraspora pellucida]
VVQERCMQIWHVGENKPDYINILNENYEALQYFLFFSYSEIGWHVYWINHGVTYSKKILQVDYYHYRIITETRFNLLGQLFNKYLVNMFSHVDDKCLQFVCKEQHRFKKKGHEEDESLRDEAELHSDNIYLPASHMLSFRWSYKKTMDVLAV